LQLDALAAYGVGAGVPGEDIVSGTDYAAAARRAHPVRVALLFGISGIIALALVYGLVFRLGLPYWVFMAAVVLVVLALPITLLTGHHERRRALARGRRLGVTTPGTGLRRWFRWRYVLVGGASAFSVLGLVTTGYMAMRLLGIGPIGTLLGAGALEEGGHIIVADFADQANDPQLAVAVTEALRVDLAQSPVISLVEAADVRDALRQSVARSIAVRDGVPALLVGAVSSIGSGYGLSVRVIGAVDEEEFLALRETAADASQVIPALERLSRRLREHIGESLRNIRQTPALRNATTASLPALRKFSQGKRLNSEGRLRQASEAFWEATTLDTTFAEAYMALALNLQNQRTARAAVVDAMSAAFRHRVPLGEGRRYQVEGAYYLTIGEYRRAADALELGLDAGNPAVLHDLGLVYQCLRELEEAQRTLLRVHDFNPRSGTATYDLGGALVDLGRLDEAGDMLDQFIVANPDFDLTPVAKVQLAVARGDLEAAGTVLSEVRANQMDLFSSAVLGLSQALLAAALGHVTEADQMLGYLRSVAESVDDPTWAFVFAAVLADVLREARGAYEPAEAVLNDARERYPLAGLAPLDRPLLQLAMVYARLGNVTEARRLVDEHDATVRTDFPRIDERKRLLALGEILLAEGHSEQAIAMFREADDGWYELTDLPGVGPAQTGLGRAYDQAGQRDSAIDTYERYLSRPTWTRLLHIHTDFAAVMKRLGELYEEQGNREKAAERYGSFVELWSDAGAQLQPHVEAVRGRIARLMAQQQN
jgi:tetratricopeptide (TPR) repeat protein